MAFPQDEIDELKRVFPSAEQYNEGGFELFFLPAVTLTTGCFPRQTDLLFCPTPRDGYPSRLFFSDRIQSPMTLNWNGGTYAIERNWHAFSLRMEASGLRLLQTVKAHLRALGK